MFGSKKAATIGVVTSSNATSSTIALPNEQTLAVKTPEKLGVNAMAIVQPLDGSRAIDR